MKNFTYNDIMQSGKMKFSKKQNRAIEKWARAQAKNLLILGELGQLQRAMLKEMAKECNMLAVREKPAKICIHL